MLADIVIFSDIMMSCNVLIEPDDDYVIIHYHDIIYITYSSLQSTVTAVDFIVRVFQFLFSKRIYLSSVISRY